MARWGERLKTWPLMMEVPGWSGYFVTRDGRVFSAWVNVGRGPGGGKGARCEIDRSGRRELQPRPSEGYPAVMIRRDGQKRCREVRVHVLVARAFFGPCPDGQEVRHLDDDKDNPAAANLAYGTRQQNVDDAVRNGRVPKGDKHWTARARAGERT